MHRWFAPLIKTKMQDAFRDKDIVLKLAAHRLLVALGPQFAHTAKVIENLALIASQHQTRNIQRKRFRQRSKKSLGLECCEDRIVFSMEGLLPLDVNAWQESPASEIRWVSGDASTVDVRDLKLSSKPDLARFSSTPLPIHQDVLTNRAMSMIQAGVEETKRQFGLQGAGQTVAIIDSGIAYDHHALGRGFGADYRVVGGWDFAENDADPYDDGPGGYHGTHVAGIIASDARNREGIAPAVDLVALRVFDDFGKSDMGWTQSALQWVYDNRDAFENPITTVNLSLGASWNSETPPSWASLEDELAKLNRAGIVVVVSAGNSFQQHLTTGLAYPAASPFTFPVSSLDANGNLSDFSQRDDRIIAAPGRAIESAVPDFFFGKDGVTNDWAKSSGTSMATAFVTGAAILTREALEMAGRQEVSAEEIYQVLRETAGSTFDPLTNRNYRTLDVAAAVRSVLRKESTSPASDNHAEPLPAPEGVPSGEGVSANPKDSKPHQRFEVLDTGDTLRINGNELANRIEIDLRSGLSVKLDDELYEPNASSIGRKFSRVVVDGLQNHDTVTIYGSSDSEMIEMKSDATILSNENFTLEINNAEKIRFVGGGGADRAYLYDERTDDRLESHPQRAVLQGVGYEYQVEQVARIYVHATQGGDDQAFVYDSAEDDVATVRPQFTSVNGPGYFNYLAGFERVFAYARSGGLDRAQIYDSAGSDLFSSSGEVTSIVGDGFSTFVRGYENVEAYSQAGGTDVAKLYAGEHQSVKLERDYAGLLGPDRTAIAHHFSVVDVFGTHRSASAEVPANNQGDDQDSQYGSAKSSLPALRTQATVLGLDSGPSDWSQPAQENESVLHGQSGSQPGRSESAIVHDQNGSKVAGYEAGGDFDVYRRVSRDWAELLQMVRKSQTTDGRSSEMESVGRALETVLDSIGTPLQFSDWSDQGENLSPDEEMDDGSAAVHLLHAGESEESLAVLLLEHTALRSIRASYQIRL